MKWVLLYTKVHFLIGGEIMVFAKAEIGIDLGTSNILIYENSKGIVLNEPAIIVIDSKTDKVVAVGSEAKDMVGKTPENLVALRPLTNGIINDFDLTAELLKRLLKKSIPSVRKPTFVVNISTDSTSVEQRAIHNALSAYGARRSEEHTSELQSRV